MLDIEIRETIRSTGWDAVGYFKGEDDDIEIGHTLIEYNARAGIKAGVSGVPGDHRNWLIHDCIIRPIEGQQVAQGNWGVHAYNAVGWSFRNVLIENIRGRGDGHAIYLMSYGGFAADRLHVRNINGQGLQLHVDYRAEGSLGYRPETKPIVVRDSTFENTCQGGMGGSAITVRGEVYDQPVQIHGVTITQDFAEHGWGQWRSKGGIVLFGSDHTRGDVEWDPQRYTYSDVEITDTRIVCHRPDRPLLKTAGVRRLIVRNCHFEAPNNMGYGTVHLEGDASRPEPEYVLFENCTGDVPVLYRGRKVSMISDRLEIGTPPETPRQKELREIREEIDRLQQRVKTLTDRLLELAA